MKESKNPNRQDRIERTDRQERNNQNLNQDIGNVEFGDDFLNDIPNKNTQEKTKSRTNNLNKNHR